MNQPIHIWFSRHKPTEAQLRELGKIDIDASDLASIEITSFSDVENIIKNLINRIRNVCPNPCPNPEITVKVFGVIPTPIRNFLFLQKEKFLELIKLETFEAWNLTRPAEGGKPTFCHYKFLKTGEYYL